MNRVIRLDDLVDCVSSYPDGVDVCSHYQSPDSLVIDYLPSYSWVIAKCRVKQQRHAHARGLLVFKRRNCPCGVVSPIRIILDVGTSLGITSLPELYSFPPHLADN